MFPIVVALVPASIITGGVITRSGKYRTILWIGLAIDVLANGLMIMWNRDTSTATWAIQMVLVGLAQGIVLNGLNFSTQATAATVDVAYSAAMYTFMRSLGMTIGVAVGGSVYQNLMKHKLRIHNLPLDIATNAEGFIHQLRDMPNNQMKADIVDAYVYGFKGVFIVLTAVIGAAFIANLAIKEYSLDQILDSQHVLARTEKAGKKKGHKRGKKSDEEQLKEMTPVTPRKSETDVEAERDVEAEAEAGAHQQHTTGHANERPDSARPESPKADGNGKPAETTTSTVGGA